MVLISVNRHCASWRPSVVPRVCQFILLGGLLVSLAACGSSKPKSDTKSNAEVEKLRKENEELREKLKEAQEEAASIQRGETVQVLSTDVYFKSGSADLNDKGVQELKKVAGTIRSQFPDRTIRIEGYTDSRPIGDQLTDKYPSNWELSAARAARVARHFQWTHEMDPERMEVVGFGQYHPVATNETEEGRRKNRRVRVAVLDSDPSGTDKDEGLAPSGETPRSAGGAGEPPPPPPSSAGQPPPPPPSSTGQPPRRNGSGQPPRRSGEY